MNNLFGEPTRKKYNNAEHNLQVKIVNLLRGYPNFYLCYAIPNGGSRDVVTGKKLKDEGATRGVQDLQIVLPDGEVFFVELKTQSGRLSEEQAILQNVYVELGYTYLVWRSVQDCLDWIREHPTSAEYKSLAKKFYQVALKTKKENFYRAKVQISMGVQCSERTPAFIRAKG